MPHGCQLWQHGKRQLSGLEEGLTCAKDVARHEEGANHEQAIDDVGLASALAQREQEPAHVHKGRAQLPHQKCSPCKARQLIRG